MRYTLAVVVLALLSVTAISQAQVFTTPTGEAGNVRFEQMGGATVAIFYDLVSSDPRAVFSVTLDASDDRGGSFKVHPTNVSGDVGPGIKPGIGKRIVWESGRDVERLEINQFRFRISAEAGPLELKVDTPVVPPATAAPKPVDTPTVEKPPVKAPAPSQTAAKPKGSAAKWALIGGGVAAAAGAAAAASGGKSSGSTTATTATTPTPTPTVSPAPVGPTSNTLSGTYSGQGTVSFITKFPSNSTECVHTYSLAGTLAMTIQQGSNGSVTGTATTTARETVVAVSAPCSTSVIGGGFSTSWEIPLTGTVQSVAFSGQQPYSSTILTGGTLVGSKTLSFSGALVGGVLSGTMTLGSSADGVSQGNAVTMRGSTVVSVSLR